MRRLTDICYPLTNGVYAVKHGDSASERERESMVIYHNMKFSFYKMLRCLSNALHILPVATEALRGKLENE